MRVAIAAGGTGGHFFPALALEEEIRAWADGSAAVVIGRRGGPEAGWASRAGVEYASVAAGSPSAGPPWRRARGLARSAAGLLQALALFARHRPDAVVGFGGYLSVPCVLAAVLLRCPVVLHEQNVVPGKATRLLARLASCVALSYPVSGAALKCRRVVVTGTPVRRSVLGAGAAAEEFGLDRGRKTLLVAGGSQGAHALNLGVVRAVRDLAKEFAGWQVLHLSGQHDRETVAAGYEEAGIRASVKAFLCEMGRAYALAALVICRAGASTVAELSAAGLPAVYVPYPGAGRHQAANAAAAAAAGGGLVLDEGELAGSGLTGVLRGLLDDGARLRQMREKAGKTGHADAARQLAMLVRETGR